MMTCLHALADTDRRFGAGPAARAGRQEPAIRALLLLAALLVAGPVAGFGGTPGDDAAAEPLAPEVAFVPSLSAPSRDTLEIEFHIEPGYYLYRDKLAFRPADGAAFTPGTPELPPGLKTEDDFFGETWIYREPVRVQVPVTVAADQTQIELDVVFQGCADIGLCYPPITQTLSTDLPAPANGLQSSALQDLLGKGRQQSGAELLSPQEAFQPRIDRSGATALTLNWQIEPGYYLYRDKLKFTLEQAGPAAIDAVDLPPGLTQTDDFFGDVQVYRDPVDIALAISPAASVSNARLVVQYQGCADIGVCFPPETVRLPVAFDGSVATAGAVEPTGPAAIPPADPSAAADSPAETASAEVPLAQTSTAASRPGATPQPASAPVSVSEQDRLANSLAASSLWLNALTFFGLGLLLAFTPCVLPMVPILSSLIVGQGERLSTAHAFRLSLIYVLAMALTYTVVGILVGLSGYNVQALFQDPWILSAFAALFVLLSLSMFGFYELQLPLALQNRLTAWSNRQQGGRAGGVAIMGFLSALIVGPCVTAPLVGALVYIAQTGDAVIGGVALFSLSMGMGVPLLLVGTSAGRLMPRSGPWMDKTKALFGVILLAMAIWMLSRFLPAGITLALAAVLAVLSGIYFGATDSLGPHSSGLQRIGKGVGLLVTLYGAALMIGALSGGQSFLTPLKGLAAGPAGASAASDELEFQRVANLDELQAMVARASDAGRPVMLDFYADWCVSCKEMEAFTFTDPAVQAALQNAVILQADVTENDAQDQQLLTHFGLFGPPAIILYDARGVELRPARVVGFMPAERFRAHLSQFIGA